MLIRPAWINNEHEAWINPHCVLIKHSTEEQGTFHCFIFEVSGTRVWNVTSSNRRTTEVVAFFILKNKIMH